jgi:hypothetical protein
MACFPPRAACSAIALGALVACSEAPSRPRLEVTPELRQSGHRIGTDSHCNPTPESNRRTYRSKGVGPFGDCDTTDLCPTCDGLFIRGWSDVHCYITPSWDPDNDGVDNACENALATAFSPLMIFTVDCDWDNGLRRMGGEYYFAVEKIPADPGFLVRIAYLPAYYWDCGAPVQRISLCRQLTNLCDPHTR